MAQYFINTLVPANTDWGVLVGLLKGAGLPVIDVQTSGAYPGQVIVVTDDGVDLTAAQQTTMNSVVAAFDPRPRVARSIYAIYTDLAALTTTQQTNVWNDLSAIATGQIVPKYLLDAGGDTAAIVVMDWVIKKSGTSGANLTDARLRIASMYVQDNPKYLVHPTFDSTINIPGDQPVVAQLPH